MILSDDFRVHNLINSLVILVTAICKAWTKPPTGVIKINFNETISNGKMGYGVIARDEDGFVLSGSGGIKDYSMIAEWAKIVAFEESLKVAKRLRKQNIILESDCANLVNTINNRENDVTIMGSHIKALCTQFDMYDSVKVLGFFEFFLVLVGRESSLGFRRFSGEFLCDLASWLCF
ncbi:hypothetical protein Gotri_023820 [Gossypium trilobum]|uniref:RNase H type-1 domain-containing protein n=1 Tax=Gossypium trilobum TaxID=34281 RepID=A0A7J9DKN7_9ROSI|nr:hypothetical protein [Gossypium trilobum]